MHSARSLGVPALFAYDVQLSAPRDDLSVGLLLVAAEANCSVALLQWLSLVDGKPTLLHKLEFHYYKKAGRVQHDSPGFCIGVIPEESADASAELALQEASTTTA